MRIQLSGHADIGKILEEYGLQAHQIRNYSIGNDGNIHILLSAKRPRSERAQSNLHYHALTLCVNWQRGDLLKTHVTNFGDLVLRLHFIQKIMDGFLLVDARCNYNNGNPERNALITNSDGIVTAQLCLGDGISDCLVDCQNRIITGYCDEGVFGNYGWHSPIGACGLILWSASGEPVWKNDAYDIVDCYAMNLDVNDRLWFYYYYDFNLVSTDFSTYNVYGTGVSGSGKFLIHPSCESFVFDGGYKARNNNILLNISDNYLRGSESVYFSFNGRDVTGKTSYRGSRVIIFDDNQGLYYGDWE